jgi:hypothetical protein
MSKKDLPIFDIVLNDDDLKQGVGMISLVDDPAIGVNWIKLAKEKPLLFKADKEKQMLYGPFLIPNMLIYRFDEQNGEYYVRFSKEEIDKIATKFNEDLNNKNINFMHTDQKVDAFVAQNWMIEGDQDKSRSLGFDLPEGTWFGGVKVKDTNFWTDKVKNEEVKGFSVEILADLQLSLKNKEQIMENEIKLGNATLADGTLIYWDGDLAVGVAIFSDEALTQAVADGEYALEDGSAVVVTGGMVEEIKAMEVEEEDLADAPVASALTAEEVSLMIDARFAELMDEITSLKSLLDQKEEEMGEYKKQVEEKFATTPAAPSIAKPEVKVDEKFKQLEDRIKAFARNK